MGIFEHVLRRVSGVGLSSVVAFSDAEGKRPTAGGGGGHRADAHKHAKGAEEE